MAALWDALCEPSSHVTVLSERCTRARFRHSECRACAAVCPEEAISLCPAPRVGGGCSGCGLCLVVCPTEVFRDGAQSDEWLLDLIRARLARDHAPALVLTIRCDRAAARDGASWRLPCVGRITETILAGIALSGVGRIDIVHGRCSECRLRHGAEVLSRSIATARALLEGVTSPAPVIREREEPAMEAPPVSRRGFFSGACRDAARGVAGVLEGAEQILREAVSSVSPRGPAARSSRRARLVALVRDAAPAPRRALPSGAAYPWARVRVDERQCTGCGACAAVCPTGAMVQAMEAGEAVLRFEAAACVNCGGCAEACAPRAIAFEGRLTVGDVFASPPSVVARIALVSCAVCGDPIPTRGGKACPTCRKRQLRPMPVGA